MNKEFGYSKLENEVFSELKEAITSAGEKAITESISDIMKKKIEIRKLNINTRELTNYIGSQFDKALKDVKINTRKIRGIDNSIFGLDDASLKKSIDKYYAQWENASTKGELTSSSKNLTAAISLAKNRGIDVGATYEMALKDLLSKDINPDLYKQMQSISDKIRENIINEALISAINEYSNNLRISIDKLYGELEKLGNGRNRVKSDIGLSEDEYYEKLKKENEEIAKGNGLFKERMTYFKNGKVVDSYIGDETSVSGAKNPKSIKADKVVHTHNPDRNGSNAFSFEDIRLFLEREKETGAKNFKLKSGNIDLDLDLSGVKNSDIDKIKETYTEAYYGLIGKYSEEIDGELKIPESNKNIIAEKLTSLMSSYIQSLGGTLKSSEKLTSITQDEMLEILGVGGSVSSIVKESGAKSSEEIMSVIKMMRSEYEKMSSVMSEDEYFDYYEKQTEDVKEYLDILENVALIKENISSGLLDEKSLQSEREELENIIDDYPELLSMIEKISDVDSFKGLLVSDEFKTFARDIDANNSLMDSGKTVDQIVDEQHAIENETSAIESEIDAINRETRAQELLNKAKKESVSQDCENGVSSGASTAPLQQVEDKLEEVEQQAKETSEAVAEVYRGVQIKGTNGISNSPLTFTSSSPDVAALYQIIRGICGEGKIADGEILKEKISLNNSLTIDAQNKTFDTISYWGDAADEAGKKAKASYDSFIESVKNGLPLLEKLSDENNIIRNMDEQLDVAKNVSNLPTYSGEINSFVSQLDNYLDFYRDAPEEIKNAFNKIINNYHEMQNEINNNPLFGVQCTNDFAEQAKEMGYSVLIIKNVIDSMEKLPQDLADDYIILDEKAIQSVERYTGALSELTQVRLKYIDSALHQGASAEDMAKSKLLDNEGRFFPEAAQYMSNKFGESWLSEYSKIENDEQAMLALAKEIAKYAEDAKNAYAAAFQQPNKTNISSSIAEEQKLFTESSGQMAFFDGLIEKEKETQEEIKKTNDQIEGQISIFDLLNNVQKEQANTQTSQSSQVEETKETSSALKEKLNIIKSFGEDFSILNTDEIKYDEELLELLNKSLFDLSEEDLIEIGIKEENVQGVLDHLYELRDRYNEVKWEFENNTYDDTSFMSNDNIDEYSDSYGTRFDGIQESADAAALSVDNLINKIMTLNSSTYEKPTVLNANNTSDVVSEEQKVEDAIEEVNEAKEEEIGLEEKLESTVKSSGESHIRTIKEIRSELDSVLEKISLVDKNIRQSDKVEHYIKKKAEYQNMSIEELLNKYDEKAANGTTYNGKLSSKDLELKWGGLLALIETIQEKTGETKDLNIFNLREDINEIDAFLVPLKELIKLLGEPLTDVRQMSSLISSLSIDKKALDEEESAIRKLATTTQDSYAKMQVAQADFESAVEKYNENPTKTYAKKASNVAKLFLEYNKYNKEAKITDYTSNDVLIKGVESELKKRAEVLAKSNELLKKYIEENKKAQSTSTADNKGAEKLSESNKDVANASNEAAEANKDFTDANNKAESSSEETASANNKEAESFEEISITATAAAAAKEKFVEANKKAKTSAEETSSSNNKEAESFEKVNKKSNTKKEKAKDPDKELMTKANELLKEYASTLNEVNKKRVKFDVDNSDIVALESIKNNINDIVSKLSSGSNKSTILKQLGKIDSSTETAGEKLYNSLSGKFSKILNKTSLTDEFRSEVEKIADSFKSLDNIDITDEKDLARLKEMADEAGRLEKASKNPENQNANYKKLAGTYAQIADFISKNTNMTAKQKAEANELLSISKEYLNTEKATSSELFNLESAFNKLKGEVIETGRSGLSSFDKLSKRISDVNTKFFAYYFSWQDWIRYAREAFSTIKELDTALVDLRKTTTMSAKDLNQFYYDANESAKKLGVTTQEVIEQASSWSRLGYGSKEEATTMAELSSQFASISPGMSTEDAQTGLVSIMKAWDISTSEVEREVMDNINVLGNKFAETNKDIIEGMERSAATFSALGQTWTDSFALFTGAQEQIQNAETVGTALKTKFCLNM